MVLKFKNNIIFDCLRFEKWYEVKVAMTWTKYSFRYDFKDYSLYPNFGNYRKYNNHNNSIFIFRKFHYTSYKFWKTSPLNMDVRQNQTKNTTYAK